MKTTKKIIAIILCVATLFSLGAVNSFAIEAGDKIRLTNEYGSMDYYLFCGDLKESINYVKFEITEQYADKFCYNFTAAKDGYYIISADTDAIWDFSIQSYITEERLQDYFLHFDDSKSYYVFSLKKGSYPVTLKINPLYFSETLEINVEYFAESITDVTYDENEINNIIIGEYVFIGSSSGYYLYNDFTVTFSNGETFTYNISESSPLCAEPKGAWKEGENAVTICVHDYSKEATATARRITDFIEKIEIPGIDKYLLSHEYYNGYINDVYFGDIPEEVIVTYTDGTSKSFSYYYDFETNDEDHLYITLPNGVSVWMYGDYETDKNTGKRNFYVAIADHTYIYEECKTKPLSFDDNLSIFGDNMTTLVKNHFSDLSFYFEMLIFVPLSPNNTVFVIKLITGITLFEALRDEISAFINYCRQ